MNKAWSQNRAKNKGIEIPQCHTANKGDERTTTKGMGRAEAT